MTDDLDRLQAALADRYRLERRIHPYPEPSPDAVRGQQDYTELADDERPVGRS